MDFVHKMSLAEKECNEILFWLKLLNQTNHFKPAEFKSMYEEVEVILKMIKSSA